MEHGNQTNYMKLGDTHYVERTNEYDDTVYCIGNYKFCDYWDAYDFMQNIDTGETLIEWVGYYSIWFSGSRCSKFRTVYRFGTTHWVDFGGYWIRVEKSGSSWVTVDLF